MGPCRAGGIAWCGQSAVAVIRRTANWPGVEDHDVPTCAVHLKDWRMSLTTKVSLMRYDRDRRIGWSEARADLLARSEADLAQITAALEALT